MRVVNRVGISHGVGRVPGHPNPREPFGMAPLEAMASGLVLGGPKRSGITGYADGSKVRLAEPDAESFAAAVQNLHDDPAAAAVLRPAARSTAERFDRARAREAPGIAPAFYAAF